MDQTSMLDNNTESPLSVGIHKLIFIIYIIHSLLYKFLKTKII